LSQDHFVFVAASYAASALVIGALISWIVLAQRARKAELAALDQTGIKRRSDTA
jgi:heme exporter protein D